MLVVGLMAAPCYPLIFSVIGNAQGLCNCCSRLFICSFSVHDGTQSAREDGSPWAEDWDSLCSPPCIMTSQ